MKNAKLTLRDGTWELEHPPLKRPIQCNVCSKKNSLKKYYCKETEFLLCGNCNLKTIYDCHKAVNFHRKISGSSEKREHMHYFVYTYEVKSKNSKV